MRSLAGTGALLRLAARLDRVRLPIWIATLATVTVSTAFAFTSLVPDVASRLQFSAGVVGNPAVIALTGPLFNGTSIGGLTAWRVGGFGAVLAALMSLLTVVRHTRAEEETGRLELVAAGAIGRLAPLTAALALVFLANLLLGVLVAVGLAAAGEDPLGAAALGLALAGAGWMFGAVAAVTAQMTEGARAASGIAGAALGVAYFLRAAGDSAGEGGPSWLSWLSPIGWTQQIRPFAGERWWVLGLMAGFVAVLVGAAYALVRRRDVGSGLVPARVGPVEAGAELASPLSLAWRLHRGALIAWALAFAVAGAAFGSIAEGVADMLDANPQLAEVFERIGGEAGVVDAFISAAMGSCGFVAAVYAAQATLRLRSEETSLRLEPILATPVGRIRWAAGHLTFALVGTGIILGYAGLTAGVVHGLRTADLSGQLPRVLAAALVQIPAALVLSGIAVALFGLVPRFVVATWGLLVVFLLLGQLGPVFQLDQLILDFSPFTHVPEVPGEEVAAAPLLGLAAVTVALIAVGLAAFRRRDIG
ncbi:MAG: ABC transporter permease [Actinomycetota bacterium]|nr:ABC transporter permease [Actinomycetota bacterium]